MDFIDACAAQDEAIEAQRNDITSRAYREFNANKGVAMNTFGWAIKQLQDGKKVSRSGWNGKGMFLIYVPGTKDAKLNEGTPYQKALNSNIVTINPHIDMYTATGEFQPGWLASQTDMLATDWDVVADAAVKAA